MIKKIEGWPFPEVTDQFKLGNHSFFEIDEEVFENQLNALPPSRLKFDGPNIIFWCSEPYNDTHHNVYIRLFINGARRHFTRLANFRLSSNLLEIQDLLFQLQGEPPEEQ